MGPLLTRLAELQDEVGRLSNAARMKKPTSDAAMAESVAIAKYQDFLRDMANDFELQFRAACENPGALNGLVRKLVEQLADWLDFDAVKAQSHWAHREVTAARHEVENLRSDVKELRAVVERLMFLDEQKGKRVVA